LPGGAQPQHDQSRAVQRPDPTPLTRKRHKNYLRNSPDRCYWINRKKLWLFVVWTV
jgi:hypothetical protein